MAFSSNLLHLLPLLVSLAIFLPCIRSDDNPDMIQTLCPTVPNTNQPSPTDADKMISNLLTFAPQNDFSYYTHQDSGLYGLAWCLGDAFAPNCSACLAGAAQKLVDICSHQTTSARIVFQDFCYLRVDTIDFLQRLDPDFGRTISDNNKENQVGSAHQPNFADAVLGLMTGIKNQVVPLSNKRIARAHTNFDLENSVIYGMAQCVDQLNAHLCNNCLQSAIDFLSFFNGGWFSRRVQIFFGGSCIIGYYKS